MNLEIPEVGITGGPEYATQINNSLLTIDSHSHLPGSGIPVVTAALNINEDLAINSNNLTSVRSVRFNPETSELNGPTDLTCTYVVGSDLYYNDATGTPVRITQNGAVAGTPGSISNLVPPASAAYVGASSTFVFESNTNVAANLDMRNAILRKSSSLSPGLTLSPPTGMVSDYTVTLPTLPAAQSFLGIDVSGNISSVANVSQGITLSMLVAAVANSLVPVSTILPFGGDSAPAGYLICQGSAVSRITYADLFAIVGTRFGQGDGSTTFNLPDLRGQFLRGVTGGSSKDPDAASRTSMSAGGAIGNNVGSIQGHAFQTHNHDVTAPVVQSSSGSSFPVPGGGGGQFSSNAQATGANSQATSSETRPTNAYVNFIIKV
jgi:microcystin-dependent protein